MNEREELEALRAQLGRQKPAQNERAEVEALRAEQPPISEARRSGPTEGAIRQFGQGASFGFSDEAGALADTLLEKSLPGFGRTPFGELYDQNLAFRAQEREQFSEDYPKTAIGAEVLGGLTTGIAGGAKLGATKAGAAFTGLSKPAQFATAGGATGAAYGAGTAKPGERLESGATSGVIGGVLGLGLPVVGGIAKRGAEKITHPVIDALSKTFRSPKTQAIKAIRRELERGNITREQAQREISKLGDEAIAAESLGEGGMDLLDQVVNTPGKSAQVAKSVLSARNRQGGQQNRLIKELSDLTGADADFLDNYTALEQVRREAAEALYAPIRGKEVPLTKGLKSILATRSGKKAWKEAQNIAADEIDGKPLPRLLRVEDGKEIIDEGVIPDVRAWDHMKRGFDTVIEKGTDPVTGKMNSAAYRALQLKNKLVSELDEMVPEYKAARQQYAGDSANISALRQGKRVLRDDAEITARDVARMSDSEKEAYVVGATKAIKDKILAAGEGATPLRLTGLLKERLKPAFKSDADFNRFIVAARRESMFKGTENRMLGSQTFRRGAREAMDAIPSSRADLVMGTMREVLSPDMAEPVRDEIGRMLLTQGDDAQRMLAKLLMPKSQGVSIPKMTVPTGGFMLGQGVGTGVNRLK